MTTLYSCNTGEPVGEFSQTTCDLVLERAPGKFFYFEPDDAAKEYLVDNIIDIEAFYKIGGTI